MRRRSAIGKPSSTTKPAERASGRAPAIGKVVDRPVHGELADVAAGEEDRLDDEGVGRERERESRSPRGARSRRAARAAGCRAPRGTALSTRCSRRLAARAVREGDQLVAKLRPARPHARDAIPPSREPSVVVVRGAGALARDHAGADRALGRAGGAEDLALPGLDRADEHLAALAGLRVVDPRPGNLEAGLGVPLGELGAQASARSARSSRGRATRTSSRSSIVSASAASARGLPSRRTTRVYWFSTSQRPSRSWRTSIVDRLQDVERLERR